MIRVVFDTNILFSAALKRTGIPTQVLDLVTDGILTPCVSDAIMTEYLDVLTRPVLHAHAARVRELLNIMATWLSTSPLPLHSLCVPTPMTIASLNAPLLPRHRT